MQIDSEASLKHLSEEQLAEKIHDNESLVQTVLTPSPLTQQLSEGSDKSQNEKYYKKFDFFYRRTAFRSMTEFYKTLFKPILEKWREGERKSTKNFVQQFICKNANLISFQKSQDFKKMQVLVNQNQNLTDFQSFQETLE